MKHGILAAAFLLASAGFASADYVIIVANVGGGKELKTPGGFGMAGMVGMGGMAGMQGGMMMGMAGMQGGMMMGMGGMRGGPPGMMGMGGMPPGMGMAGMPPGMGKAGGQAQGMPPGMRGGMMMGMRGGMMMGMRGGMMMGMGGLMGMMGGSIDADDVPDFVIAVVEVKPTNTKNMAQYFKKRPGALVNVALPEHLGKSCQLLKNPPFGEMFIITEGKDKPIPTVSDRFNERFSNTIKEKPSVETLLDLAAWTLEHGLVDKFPVVMDKLVETDKGHSAAVAYLKVKADLARKPGDDASVAAWRGKLLPRYKVTETPHYLIVHNAANDTAVEIKTHAEHLENAFRGFYYWFALKGTALSVPRNRQVVVLTGEANDFTQLQKILTSGPVVVDGFFARRENLAVMYSQRQDDTYASLNTFWETWKGRGYKRLELLGGGKGSRSGVPASARQDILRTAEAQMLALMLKALEQEAELATVSHDASRQLLFASGLLPRNVAVPEWILFGMGSFFETPLQSPWPTIGAPSPYYLPRWREQKDKFELAQPPRRRKLATLRQVVTDSYFRSLPPDSKADSDVHRLHEAALRKARTVSWSLTYFLAQQHLDGLRRYFTELSKMPRDLELDDTVLLGCFARAFGCVDGNNKVDDAKLSKLAEKWYIYLQNVNFESEGVMSDIRKKIADKVKEAEEKAQKQNEGNGGQQGPGLFPGMNPGGLPPGVGPGGFPPGRNPQQGGRFPPANPPQGDKPRPRR